MFCLTVVHKSEPDIFSDDVFLLERSPTPLQEIQGVYVCVCVFLVPCRVGLLLDVLCIALVTNVELFIVLDKAHWW